jgi:hypothetical protein
VDINVIKITEVYTLGKKKLQVLLLPWLFMIRHLPEERK